MSNVQRIQEGWTSSADGTRIGFIQSGNGPALVDAHIAPLPGQGHTAHMMTPDLVAEIISQFLLPERSDN
jgi:hypothetical protein